MAKDNTEYNEIYESLLKTQPQLTTSQRRKFAKTILAGKRKTREMLSSPPGKRKEGNLELLARLPDYDTRDREGD